MPFAYHNLIKLPEGVTDDQAILMGDIYPTAYFGAHLAEVRDGDVVAVWGCGPIRRSKRTAPPSGGSSA